jgi:hypothetical protein
LPEADCFSFADLLHRQMKRKTLSLRPLHLCGNIFYPLVSRVWPLKAQEKTANQLFPITNTDFRH